MLSEQALISMREQGYCAITVPLTTASALKQCLPLIGCTLTEVNALRSRMLKMCGVSSLPCLALLVLNRQGSFLFDWQGLFCSEATRAQH